MVPVIHIVGDGPEINIWLDTEGSFQDGTIIGVGKTTEEAIGAALVELEHLVGQLQSQRRILQAREWRRVSDAWTAGVNKKVEGQAG